MSANFVPNQNEYKNLTPFKCWLLHQINNWGQNNFPFVESDFDELTNYGMLMKMMKALKDVISNQNEVEQDMTNLFGAFTELQAYVNNYFDNLDVQDEVNNKLDEMVESGELQEIIATYLNSKAIFGFDNVESMKNATNLINGSYAQTLGFYEKNDDGGALYKIRNITNDDVVDDMFIIEMNDNNLIAELIFNNDLNIKQVGAKSGDATFNNASIIYKTLKYFSNKKGGQIYIPTGIYNVNTQINIDFDIYSIMLFGDKGVPTQNTGTILNYTNNGFMINFNGRCNNCEFKDFMILCSNNNGMSFNLTAHKTKLNNITIKDAIKGLLFNTGTYTRVDNLTLSSSNPLSEYGIQIGSEMPHYTTEFFYITNCSIDFDNVSEGICLNILKTEGGIWVHDNDFCNTNGKAIQIDNQRGGSSNYYDFDNNNISGCKYGFYLNASTGNIGGVMINNQRIAINGYNVDERFIYTTKSSNYNTDLHTSGMYLRTRNANVVPTYLYEITTNSCSVETELSFDAGEFLDSPIYCNSNIRKIHDVRIYYCLQLNTNYFDSTGDKQIKLSNKKCLIKGSSFVKWQTGNANAIDNIYFIRCTYDTDGYPIANIRITGNVPNSRINLFVSEEFSPLISTPLS